VIIYYVLHTLQYYVILQNSIHKILHSYSALVFFHTAGEVDRKELLPQQVSQRGLQGLRAGLRLPQSQEHLRREHP